MLPDAAQDVMVFEAGVGAPALSLRRTAAVEQLHPAGQLADLDGIAEDASDGAAKPASSLPAQPPANAAVRISPGAIVLSSTASWL